MQCEPIFLLLCSILFRMVIISVIRPYFRNRTNQIEAEKEHKMKVTMIRLENDEV